MLTSFVGPNASGLRENVKNMIHGRNPGVLRNVNSYFSVKPLSVRLLEKPKVLMADTQYNITCEAVGSRPQAKISWHRGKELLRRGKVSTAEGTKF